MGMTEMLAKVKAYDNAKAVAIQNQVSDAELRAAMAEEKANQIAGLARSVLDPRYVAAQNAYIPPVDTNPDGIANVPGKEIPGYTIPSQGAVGPSSFKRPAVVPAQSQGLGWSAAMGNGYIQ